MSVAEVLTVEQAAARLGTDPERLARRLAVDAGPSDRRKSQIPAPPEWTGFTEPEWTWLASTEAQVIAARARQDAEAGRPMLQPVNLDGYQPDTAAVDRAWSGTPEPPNPSNPSNPELDLSGVRGVSGSPGPSLRTPDTLDAELTEGGVAW